MHKDNLKIMIVDEGSGIPEKIKEKILTFFTTKKSTGWPSYSKEHHNSS
jgi:phosphoglycerate-specific signal transduction histidine kinase